VAAAVGKFPEPRRADLWSGVGLAATFAGGSDQNGLGKLRRASGEYYDELALGVVFAVKARTYSSYVPAHTHLAAGVLIDLSVQGAQNLADRTEQADGEDGPEPAYELWRQRIRTEFDPAARRKAG
jgi:hypothetical protein